MEGLEFWMEGWRLKLGLGTGSRYGDLWTGEEGWSPGWRFSDRLGRGVGIG